MSKEIDTKVVEMQFDNRNFEENVQTSLSTLDKLKNALNFKGAEKAFDSLDRAATDVDLSPISRATEQIGLKFNAMEVAAVTALANITNSAMNTGKQLLASLTVDNISAGWDKFGNKTTSVGTLISQGYDMDTVTKQLERLNWYTDETSYNFTDMVSNIAKFTATGQDLETSVTAMEGIANWAALSGQNAQVASRAMYNISQAMGAGSMKLIDYKSIQNASMDTDEFRQKVLDAAVELGKLKKIGADAYQTLDGKGEFTKTSFTTELAKGWFDKDVMMKVFNEYSAAVDDIYEYATEHGLTASDAIEQMGDSIDAFGLKAFRAGQEARTWADVLDSVKDAVSTGWMNTFENIFGDYEEAKQLWTDLANELYDVFAEGGNKRNELLTEWKELGGREVLLESFWNVFNALKESIDLVKESFHDIFPEMTVRRLLNITLYIRDLTARLRLSDETIDRIKRTLRGVFSILDLGLNTVKAVIRGLSPLFDSLGPLGNDILDVTAAMGDFFTNLDESAKALGIFDQITNKISAMIEVIMAFMKNLVKYNVADYMKGFSRSGNVLSGILAAVMGNIGNLVQMILSLISAVTGIDLSGFAKNVAVVMDKVFAFLYTKFDDIVNFIKNLVSNIVNSTTFTGAISDIGNGIKSLFDSITNFGNSGFRNVSSSPLGKIAEGIGDFVNTIANSESIADAAKKVTEKIKMAVGGLIESFGTPQFRTFIAIIQTGVLLYIAKTIKDFIDSFLAIKAPWLSKFFDGLTGALNEFQANMKAKTLLNIAQALTLLAASLYALSTIDVEKLASAIVGLGAAFAGLMISFSKIGKLIQLNGADNLGKVALLILSFSGSLILLDIAMERISKLSFEEIVRGLTGIFGLMWGLTKSFNSMAGLARPVLDSAKALVVMAVALNLLIAPVTALALLSMLNPWAVLESVSLVILSMIALSESMKALTSLSASAAQASKALILMGIALNFLIAPIIAISALSMLDPWAALQGVSSLILMMVGLAAITEIIDKVAHNLIPVSQALILFGIAINTLVVPLVVLGALPWPALLQGGISLIVMMAALFGVAVGLEKLSGNIRAAAGGIMMFAGALVILVAPIVALGLIPWDIVVRGLEATGLALAGVTIAAILLKQLSGNILKASAGIILLAVALNLLIAPITAIGLIAGTENGFAKVAVSIGGLVVGLYAMVGALALMKKIGPQALVGAESLNIAGRAIERFGAVVIAFSAFKPATLAVGVLAMAAAIGVVILMLKLAGTDFGGALTLLAAAQALVKIDIAVAGLVASLTFLITTLIGLRGSLNGLAASIALLVGAVMAGLLGIIAFLASHTEEIFTNLEIFLSAFFSFLVSMTPKIVQTIIGIIGGIITGILAGIAVFIGPLCEAVIQILIAVLKVIRDYIVPLVEVAMEAVTAVLIAIGKFIPLVIQAIVELIFAIIDGIADEMLTEENAKRLYNSLNHLFDNLNRFIITFFLGDTTYYDVGLGIMGEMLAGFKVGLSEFVAKVAPTLEEIGEWLKESADKWNAFFEGIGAGLYKVDSAIRSGVSSFINFFEGVGAKVYDIVSAIKEKIEELFGFFEQVGAKTYDFVHSIPSAMDGVISGLENAKSGTNSIKDWADDVTNWFDELADGIKGSAKNAKGSIDTASKGIQDSVDSTAENVKDSVETAANGVSESTGVINDTVSKMGDGVAKGSETVKDSISKMGEGISESSETVKNKVTEMGTSVDSALNSCVDESSGTLNAASTAFTNMSENVSKSSEDVINSVSDMRQSVSDNSGAVVDSVKGMASESVDAVKGMASDASDAGEKLDKATADGIDKGSETVKDSVSRLGNGLVDTFKGFIPSFGDLGVSSGKVFGFSFLDSFESTLTKNYGRYLEKLTPQQRTAGMESAMEAGDWARTINKQYSEHQDKAFFNDLLNKAQKKVNSERETKTDDTGYSDFLGEEESDLEKQLKADLEQIDILYNTGAIASEEEYHKRRLALLENYKGEWTKTTSGWLKAERDWFKKQEENANKATKTTKSTTDEQSDIFTEFGKTIDGVYDKAAEKYDRLLEKYKSGEITAAEYEKKYNKLLISSAFARNKLMQHADEEMKKYATEMLQDISDDYEDKLSDIHSKMESFSESMSGDLRDSFKMKTRSDVQTEAYNNASEDLDIQIRVLQKKRDEAAKLYGESNWYTVKLQKDLDEANKKAERLSQRHQNEQDHLGDEKLMALDDQIAKLEDQRDSIIKLYGSNAAKARELEKQIKDLEKQEDEYLLSEEYRENRKNREKSKDKLDSKIVGVEFTDQLKEDAENLKKYNEELKKLTNRDLAAGFTDILKDMTQEEGLAFAEYLNGLSDDELRTIMSQWEAKKTASRELSETMYAGEVEQATTEFQSKASDILAELPDSGYTAGQKAMKEIGNGFSDAANETLEQCNTTMYDVIDGVFSEANRVRLEDKMRDSWKTALDHTLHEMEWNLNSQTLNLYLRPVIETSDIGEAMAQAGMMMGIEGSSAYYTQRISAYMNESKVNQVSDIKESIDNNTNATAHWMDALDARFDRLERVYEGLEIVIDENSLADGLAVPMSKRMGRYATMQSRGG